MVDKFTIDLRHKQHLSNTNGARKSLLYKIEAIVFFISEKQLANLNIN